MFLGAATIGDGSRAWPWSSCGSLEAFGLSGIDPDSLLVETAESRPAFVFPVFSSFRFVGKVEPALPGLSGSYS